MNGSPGSWLRYAEWRDAVGVVQVRGGALDRAYIDAQAATLGLASEVVRLFEDART